MIISVVGDNMEVKVSHGVSKIWPEQRSKDLSNGGKDGILGAISGSSVLCGYGSWVLNDRIVRVQYEVLRTDIGVNVVNWIILIGNIHRRKLESIRSRLEGAEQNI